MRAARTLAFVVACCLPLPAQAAELSVFCAGAVRGVVAPLTAEYEKASGDHVTFTFGTVGQLVDGLKAGRHADVVLLSASALDALETAGSLAAGTRADLGKTGVGIAVKAGAPVPDVSTPAAFKRALLAAKSVGYADPDKGATSGKYVVAAFQKLGIATDMQAKSTKTDGGFVAQLVADGVVEMALQNTSEIVPIKGVTLAGPFPPELQVYTTYGGGVMGDATTPPAARAFMATLTSPTAALRWRSAGFEAPK